MAEIVATTSLPVDRLTAINCNAAARANIRSYKIYDRLEFLSKILSHPLDLSCLVILIVAINLLELQHCSLMKG